MGKKEENAAFICAVWQNRVTPLKNGSYRNHCPFCLSSLHVDLNIPGDRKSLCHGVMKAVRLKFNGKKGWQLIHQCVKCGIEKVNKIAEGDEQSDDLDAVMKLVNTSDGKG
jgi:hypothetical protein